MSRTLLSSTTIIAVSFAVLVGAASWWLISSAPSSAKSEKPPPPANVTKVVKEDDLNIITLTADAEKRIGITTGAVEKKAVRRVRAYGGEVTVPVGKSLPVVAPLPGTIAHSSERAHAWAAAASCGPIVALLSSRPSAGMPGVGVRVAKGSPVFDILPLLTPDGRATMSAALAEADGQVNNARTQLELAKIALDRAKRVLKEGAGSQRQVDEAQAAFDLAAKTLEAATTRRSILARVLGDADTGTAAPIPLGAPCDGILRTLSVWPGQIVPSGAPLFEVVDLSTMWLRVPLPVGDLDIIDRTAPAQVGKLSGALKGPAVMAVPIPAPPSANAASATVDEFFEIPNPDGKLIPGQRLGVSIPLTDAKESLTVPWSAVVYDIHGGTWVFEMTGPRQFVPRRVAVAYSVGPDAVLSGGPNAGTKIVTAGVQQLFGAETGFVK